MNFMFLFSVLQNNLISLNRLSPSFLCSSSFTEVLTTSRYNFFSLLYLWSSFVHNQKKTIDILLYIISFVFYLIKYLDQALLFTVDSSHHNRFVVNSDSIPIAKTISSINKIHQRTHLEYIY